MATSQFISKVLSGGSYFSLDVNSELTTAPFVNDILESSIFALDLSTGDLSPSIDGDEDSFFEIVGGEITPKVL